MNDIDFKSYALLIGQQYLQTQDGKEIDWSFIPSSSAEFNMELSFVPLPSFASDLGDQETSSFPVPLCCMTQKGLDFQSIDWWRVIFILSTCQFEWLHEQEKGPIHSYAFKLPKHLKVLYSKAWVNRIFLFLRRWVTEKMDLSEETLFLPLPKGKIHLSHDIDYIEKTLPLRIKQSVMITFQLVKQLCFFNLKNVFEHFKKLNIFLMGRANYWQFETIEALEESNNLTSTWHIFAGAPQKSFKEWLLDPGYSLQNEKFLKKLLHLKSKGHEIGLHQGFNSWQTEKAMADEKNRLEKALASPVTHCRQHWLRFSFKDTWKAQEESNFKIDATLGFNDLPGFRNSSAIKMPAWIHTEKRKSHSLSMIPTILMDSQLFDYHQLSPSNRKALIDTLLEEVAKIGGEASVIWHQRVFHPDYDWGKDYKYLIERCVALGLNA